MHINGSLRNQSNTCFKSESFFAYDRNNNVICREPLIRSNGFCFLPVLGYADVFFAMIGVQSQSPEKD